jgi:hypothetical protein
MNNIFIRDSIAYVFNLYYEFKNIFQISVHLFICATDNNNLTVILYLMFEILKHKILF